MPYTHKQLLMVARDVTQMHELEGARRNFFANVSHELRTPTDRVYRVTWR
ncbi:hypothetical protein ACNKHU_02100 [Shigella flexneri]